MKLLELRVENFRQHRSACFRFAPGFNAVVGPNEAGKSALRDALRMALFANPASDRHDEAVRPWGGAGAPVLQLVFEVPQGRFELVKDFGAGRVLLKGQGRTWERPREVQQAIGRALGFQSEKAFLATAHVRQAELHRIGERDVAAQLGRIVAGADEDASRALQALQRALEDLERGLARPASNPGRLSRARQRLRELQARVEDLRRDVQEARNTALKAAGVRERLAELEAELKDRNELLDLNRRVQQARERSEWLRKEVSWRREVLEQVEALEERVRRDREELERLPPAEDGTLERVRDSLRRAEELEARAAQLERSAVELPEVQPPARWVWGVAGAAAVAAAWPGLPDAMRAVLLAVAVAAAFAGWRSWQRAETARRVRADAEAQNRERSRLAGQLRAQAQDLRAQAKEHLAAAQARSVEELEDRVGRRRQLEQALQSSQERIQGLLRGRDPQKLREELQTLSVDLHAQLQFLDDEAIRAKVLLPLELQRLEGETQRLVNEQQQLQRELQRLEVQLEAAPDEEALLRAEEELAACRAELERLERRRQALRAAVEVLEEAKAAVEVPARRAVEEKAGKSLARLTGGRYTRVRVPHDADRLRVEVWSEEAGCWLVPEEPQLSRGTVDLVYLAARVALVDVLAPGVRPPLLLDDPFVTFDPERRHRALDWLRELSTERQVFLFTWDEAVARHADAVVRLPRPGPEPGGPPEPAAGC